MAVISKPEEDSMLPPYPADSEHPSLKSGGDIEDQGRATDSDTEAIGRQIELESDNAIKYRTCSWQKV